uniref:NADP-dependent oxidoreductase domain-containing protein n=1 Tax=Amphora coffeiformis TaxID=265554 RepID=A0A7S3P9G7_9STRA|mmetsp:Transcript_11952/g.22970  ORF Transcript_11952/g.22970 Transcript_11952/m.22970 type:complete len:413 (+) Transcript_11952:108-1346(+)
MTWGLKIFNGILLLLFCSWMSAQDVVVTSFAFTPSRGQNRWHLSTPTQIHVHQRAANDDVYNKHHHQHVEMDRRSALWQGAFGVASLATATGLSFPQTAWAVSPTTSSTWILENNIVMPVLALNTVGLTADETERAITLAVQNGMTHVDFHPGKERDGVAQYLAHNTATARDQLFLNTKVRKAPPGISAADAAARTRAQIADDLQALNVDHVDMLMLRDSPDCDVIQAQWKVMEEALTAGQTRSVGVINFCEKALTCLLETAKVKPALNYYMLHVGMGKDAHGLRTFCDAQGIRTFAYGAVGEPGPNVELLNSPVVMKIAKAHKKSPEQVALRWVLQNGAAASVRPTLEFGLGTGACRRDGSCEQGLVSRARSLDWSLSPQEMQTLDALTSPDDNPTLFSSAGCPGAFVMPK